MTEPELVPASVLRKCAYDAALLSHMYSFDKDTVFFGNTQWTARDKAINYLAWVVKTYDKQYFGLYPNIQVKITYIPRGGYKVDSYRIAFEFQINRKNAGYLVSVETTGTGIKVVTDTGITFAMEYKSFETIYNKVTEKVGKLEIELKRLDKEESK